MIETSSLHRCHMITIELKPWDRFPDTHMQLRVDNGDQHFTWIEPNAASGYLNTLALCYATVGTLQPSTDITAVRFFKP